MMDKKTDKHGQMSGILSDIRALSLALPCVASSVGLFCFTVLAYSLTELDTLPHWFRTGLVLVGAFALAGGGEVGTMTATVEIFRKKKAGNVGFWDWLGFGLSLSATAAAFVLAWATLLRIDVQWVLTIRRYGPVALAVLAAFDCYANFWEFGFYLHDRNGAMSDKPAQPPREEWPRMRKAEFDRIVSGMNGNAPTTVAQVAALCAEHERQAPSDRTIARWLT